jgi:IPT/TIG domain
MMSRQTILGAGSLTAALFTVLLAAGCQGDGQMSVTGINPQAGHIAGDQRIEIQGKNFRTDIGYTVYFGNAKAKGVTIRGTESLLVTTPSGEVGPTDVTVRADDGNAFRLKQAFKYEDMGGSVVEGLGQTAERKEKGNLAF